MTDRGHSEGITMSGGGLYSLATIGAKHVIIATGSVYTSLPGVELDGEETYDIYYAFDTASVFNQIRDAVADRPLTATPIVRGDRSIIERVASRDIQDREAVEAAYLAGDRTLRRDLLEAAIEHPEAARFRPKWLRGL